MKSSKRVLFCLGTRPEVIKLAPVFLEAQATKGIEPVLCSTGQQKEMVSQALHVFGLKTDFDGAIMRASQSLFDITLEALNYLRDVLEKTKPDVVMVQGDTTTCFAAALAAFYNKIPVAHVEAGLRSFDRYLPFPEEINRVLTTDLTTFHFAPTERAARALQGEGVKREAIHVVGNTVVDAHHWVLKNVKSSEAQQCLDQCGKRALVLITVHRRENLDENIDIFFQTFRKMALEHPDAFFFYPVHPRPLIQQKAEEHLKGLDNLKLVPPIDFAAMTHLVKACRFLITDSGGLQEEALCAGKPVLILRSVTERPEVVEHGNGVLIGADMKMFQDYFSDLMSPKSARFQSMSKVGALIGDGAASRRICETLVHTQEPRKTLREVHPAG